jgi:hypothetical protein
MLTKKKHRSGAMRRAVAALCLLAGAGGWLALGSAPAHASTLADPAPLPTTLFSYPSFTAASGSSLNLAGRAQLAAPALQLISNDAQFLGGAAWRTQPVDVDSGWQSQFTFQLPAAGASPEGLAFVIQGDSATARGADGPNLDFAGIAHSLAVEIGLTSNAFLNEPAAPFISVQTAGSGQNSANFQDSVGASQPADVRSLTDGAPHTLLVQYQPPQGSFSGAIRVYLDKNLRPVVDAPGIDLGSKLGLTGSRAWLGFTASNGTSPNTETTDINSWSFQPFHADEAAITSPAGSGQEGADATLGPVTVTLENCGLATPPCDGAPVDAPADVTVALQSSSPDGVFATTAKGKPVTSVTIPAGADSATFFYGDTQVGSPVITATPQAAGVTAATQTETITAQPLAVTTAGLPDGTAGQAYKQDLAASGGVSPYTWSVTAGSLPDGLSLSPSGEISGTPRTSGTFQFTVQAADAESPQLSASQALSVTIGPGTITATVTGSQSFGSSAATFTETDDAPSGVSLSGTASCTTVNGGTAVDSSLAAGGDYTIDGSSCSGLSAPSGYTLSYTGAKFAVNKAAQAISFSAPDSGKAGDTATLTAKGGGSGNPVTFSADPASGSGVCTVSGQTVSYLTAGNCVIDADQAGDANYQAAPPVGQTIAVKAAALSVTTASLPDAALGTRYAARLAAAGGTSPYTWAVASGSLPPGVSLDPSAGTLSGPPAVTGTFTVTVRATDSGNPAATATATAQLSLTVGVGATGTTITGPHSGALTIGPGVTSIDGATLTGKVTVKAGAVLSVTGSAFSGPLTVSSAASLTLCGSTVDGPVAITGVTGQVLLGATDPSACAADTFGAPVALSSNSGNVVLAGAKISGPTAVNGNTGGTLLAGNTIGAPLACAGNNPPPADGGQPNTVSAPASGQCAGLVKNG